MSDDDARLLNLTENLERKDLNPWEEAVAISRLFPDGVSLRVAAARLKRDTRWVHVRLRMLKLPVELQHQVAAGLLTLLDVEFLSGLGSREDQLKVAEQMVAGRRRSKSLDPKLRRSFRKARSKADIATMNAYMLERGITGLAPRMGAWCACYISDEEFQNDINDYLNSPRVPACAVGR